MIINYRNNLPKASVSSLFEIKMGCLSKAYAWTPWWVMAQELWGRRGDLSGRSGIFSCLTFNESTICYRSWVLFRSERLHFQWLMSSRISAIYQSISDFLSSFLSTFLIGRGHHHWLWCQLDHDIFHHAASLSPALSWSNHVTFLSLKN